MNIIDSSIISNKAEIYGGALNLIYQQEENDVTIIVKNCIFRYNTASRKGGAIDVIFSGNNENKSVLYIIDNQFFENNAESCANHPLSVL